MVVESLNEAVVNISIQKKLKASFSRDHYVYSRVDKEEGCGTTVVNG